MSQAYHIKKIHDINGQPYFGLTMTASSSDSDGNTIAMFKRELETRFGKDATLWEKNLDARNRFGYHLTLFNVQESTMLSDQLIKWFESCVIDDLKFVGLGSISKGDDSTFYIVAKSVKLAEIREACYHRGARFEKEKHFHVTIAFTKKDLFHAPKNESTILS